MDIYVGNLAWKAKRQDLKELFEHFGPVEKAFIVRDKRTRRSKGYGFVKMENSETADVAINALNNTTFLERTLIVNEAKPREDIESENEEYEDEENVS